MTQPRVLCILPYHLPQYVERARACFEAQLFENKVLCECDTSDDKRTVGAIRNALISVGLIENTGITHIAHFDSDDWSSPYRIEDQMAFMYGTMAEVVGYSDMAFMDDTRNQVKFFEHRGAHKALGTSLLYRRETWERMPFPDRMIGEDEKWLDAVGRTNVASCSSLVGGSPRMIATIHKGNTSAKTGSRFAPASKELEAEVRRLLCSSQN